MMYKAAFAEIGADMDKTVNVRAEVSKAATDGGGLGHFMTNIVVCDITEWGEEIHCVGEVPYLGKEELLISSLSICNQMELVNSTTSRFNYLNMNMKNNRVEGDRKRVNQVPYQVPRSWKHGKP